MKNMVVKAIVNYNKHRSFPHLYINKSYAYIVYMTQLGHGTVIGGGSVNNPNGTVNSLWNMEDFNPFYGVITLENK
jgi:hypothetical protein